MKKYLLTAVVTAAIATWAAPAFAGPFTFNNGNQLYRYCLGEDDPATKSSDRVYCIGYIVGVADAMSAVRAANGAKPCIREGISVQQLVDVVIKSLHDHPEKRGDTAASIAGVAIADAYCPAGDK
ncbi:Rap1a/Tai family immunity protein [Rhizobium sp. LEGMi198b]